MLCASTEYPRKACQYLYQMQKWLFSKITNVERRKQIPGKDDQSDLQDEDFQLKEWFFGCKFDGDSKTDLKTARAEDVLLTSWSNANEEKIARGAPGAKAALALQAASDDPILKQLVCPSKSVLLDRPIPKVAQAFKAMVTHPLAEEAIHFRKVEPPTSRVMLWSPDGKPVGEASAKAAASPEVKSAEQQLAIVEATVLKEINASQSAENSKHYQGQAVPLQEIPSEMCKQKLLSQAQDAAGANKRGVGLAARKEKENRDFQDPLPRPDGFDNDFKAPQVDGLEQL